MSVPLLLPFPPFSPQCLNSIPPHSQSGGNISWTDRSYNNVEMKNDANELCSTFGECSSTRFWSNASKWQSEKSKHDLEKRFCEPGQVSSSPSTSHKKRWTEIWEKKKKKWEASYSAPEQKTTTSLSVCTCSPFLSLSELSELGLHFLVQMEAPIFWWECLCVQKNGGKKEKGVFVFFFAFFVFVSFSTIN